jgi:predicted aspartyl protease
MKKTLRAGLAAGISLVYCTVTGVSQNLSPEIPFRMVNETLIVIAVLANGQGPYDFVLDTGTDLTIVDPSLADKLTLARFDHVRQVSVAGQGMLERSYLSSLALGSAHTDLLPVLIERLDPVRHLDHRIQGVLGQNFLSHFNYLLDYSRHTVRFESENEMRDSLQGAPVLLEPRLDPVQGKMIIRADAHALSDSTLRLVLDSGANSVVLMRDAWERMKVPVRKIEWEHTLTGYASVYAGLIHTVTIGTQQLHEVKAVSSTESASQFADGLLPTSLFQSIYVNNRMNFVVFNPQPGSRKMRSRD